MVQIISVGTRVFTQPDACDWIELNSRPRGSDYGDAGA